MLAHELGHHVQNLLGTSDEVRQAQQGASPDEANELSVRLELQADCYAGIWGHSAQERGLIEPGDIEEGLDAAAAVGDDALGNGDQESWTHGSSESRAALVPRRLRLRRPRRLRHLLGAGLRASSGPAGPR